MIEILRNLVSVILAVLSIYLIGLAMYSYLKYRDRFGDTPKSAGRYFLFMFLAITAGGTIFSVQGLLPWSGSLIVIGLFGLFALCGFLLQMAYAWFFKKTIRKNGRKD